MSDGDFRERLWGRFEGAIDAFHDTDREVLPKDAWRFILYFANQARWPFVLLLIVGGLAGAVDAALYWSVGWLIDLLDHANPATLFSDHWADFDSSVETVAQLERFGSFDCHFGEFLSHIGMNIKPTR